MKVGPVNCASSPGLLDAEGSSDSIEEGVGAECGEGLRGEYISNSVFGRLDRSALEWMSWRFSSA